MAEFQELTGSDSETKTATPGGTASGTGEKASLGASGSSGAGRRIDLTVRDNKNNDHSSYFKSIKGHSLEFNIAAALGLDLHHPIMGKLCGIRDQTY